MPTSDLHEFRMSLFGNGGPEDFFGNFNMNLAASGTLKTGAKYQYSHTLVRGEALRQFDSFSADVEGTETLNIDYVIRSLSQ